jgi:hypothetical protein
MEMAVVPTNSWEITLIQSTLRAIKAEDVDAHTPKLAP